MTSADLRVANRPQGVARRLGTRSLLATLVAALAALAFSAAPGFAVETTSTSASATTSTQTTATATESTTTGYSQTPELKEEKGATYKTKPKKPRKEVLPEKEEVTPKQGVEPNKETAEPTEPISEPIAEPVSPTTESELPFTGYDLRWVIGIGLLLLVGGMLSLLMVKRRERHGHR